MGLFDRKYCDICGEKIGLLGNRKLENGNLCKECANKLSPWFSDRRSSTVEEIREQLAYREENREAVAALRPTLVLGRNTKVMVDERAGKFCVSAASDWSRTNPDVIDLADVTGCELDITESCTELKRKNKDGKEVSYVPQHWSFDYNVYVNIRVSSPWFDEIRFRVNSSAIEINPRAGVKECDPNTSAEYRETVRTAEEIRAALLRGRFDEPAEAPKAVVCPYCGATTVPDEKGCCEYCGSAIGGAN